MKARNNLPGLGILRETKNITVFSARYLKSSVGKDRNAYFIGIVTVLIVVFYVSLLMNGVRKSPAIFARLAEETTGEMDVVCTS